MALDGVHRVLTTQQRILVRLLARLDAGAGGAGADGEVDRLVDDLRHNEVVRALVVDDAAAGLGLAAGSTLRELAAASPPAAAARLRRQGAVLQALSAADASVRGRPVAPSLADFLR